MTKRDPPLIVVSFGNPYRLAATPAARAFVAAYCSNPFSQRAVARALLGEIAVSGRLPMQLPGLYPRGRGLTVKSVSGAKGTIATAGNTTSTMSARQCVRRSQP